MSPEATVKRSRENVKQSLLSGITTMRDFLDRAEKDLTRHCEVGRSHEAIEAVMHGFNWGIANASSSFEHALSYAKEEMQAAVELNGAAQ